MKVYTGLDSQGREPLTDRVARYLGTWPQGLSTNRMAAWVERCSRGGGYTEQEYFQALRDLRDSGRVAIANGIWYLRRKSNE